MTKHYVVFGRVQGVGFRYFTWKEAKRLGVLGSVRNRQDGAVEIFAQGTELQIAEFEQWLNIGPKTAKVDALIVNQIDTQDYDDFSIIHD